MKLFMNLAALICFAVGAFGISVDTANDASANPDDPVVAEVWVFNLECIKATGNGDCASSDCNKFPTPLPISNPGPPPTTTLYRSDQIVNPVEYETCGDYQVHSTKKCQVLTTQSVCATRLTWTNSNCTGSKFEEEVYHYNCQTGTVGGGGGGGGGPVDPVDPPGNQNLP